MNMKNIFATTSKESPEMSQAKANLEDAETALRESIFRLGQTYYKENRTNAGCEYAELVTLIGRQEENRRGFYQNVLRLEGKMMCENCGEIIPFGSAYCSACGNRPNAKPETSGAPDTAVIKCKICGATVEQGSIFCPSCGNKMK